MHIFDLYRRGLSMVIAVYALVRLIQAVGRWAPMLAGASRTSRLVRGYVTVMFVSIRLRRFWLDLVEIILLLGILAMVIYSHAFLLDYIG